MKIRTGIILVAILAATTATTAFAQGSGADTFKAKCAMCHGADGLGATPAGKAMQVPPLNSPDLVKASVADLIAATTNGKGKMPAYADKLTDVEIRNVALYIRTLQKK